MGRDLEINDVLAIKTGFEVVHIFWRRSRCFPDMV
jgi:hypothetical protein